MTREKKVECLTGLSSDRLASENRGKTIKIWDLNTLACIKTLDKHMR
jgi:WD40 repeat protein